MTYHTFESVKQDAKRTADKKNPIYSEMTLRDYFAAKVLQAQLSMPETAIAISTNKITFQDICGGCYEMADAMLKEREA
jgi:cytidylate kinase